MIKLVLLNIFKLVKWLTYKPLHTRGVNANMDPFTLAAALVGGTNVVSGIFANETNKKNQKDQRIWEQHMWEMQNEYNKPLNQRKRLEEAGFSPLGVFDGSVANTADAPETGQALAPNALPEFMNNAVKSGVDAYFSQEQLDVMKQNADSMRINALTSQMLGGFTARSKELENQFKEKTFDSRVGYEFGKTQQLSQSITQSREAHEMTQKINEETYQQLLKLNPKILKLKDGEIRAQNIQNALGSIKLIYADAKEQAQLSQILRQNLLLSQELGFNEETLKHKIKTDMKDQNLKADQQEWNKIMDVISTIFGAVSLSPKSRPKGRRTETYDSQGTFRRATYTEDVY